MTGIERNRLENKKASLLNKIATTMFKVYEDDMKDFIGYCERIGIAVDSSHLDHDGCLTIENELCVEVIADE